jgi:hypothetical protein
MRHGRCQKRIDVPPAYRMYFRGVAGRILGRYDFDAADDDTAMLIASSLFDTCSDVCDSFELWQASRRVDGAAAKPVSQSDALHALQDEMRQHEQRLRDSAWAIAKSLRLLALIKRPR